MGSLTIQQTISKYKTLEEGRVDARVMGIIGLGEQPQNPYNGQAKPPIQKVKFIFETDKYNSEEDDKETLCVSRAVPVTCGERSNLNKVLSAVKNTSLSQDQCEAIVGDDKALSDCLGTPLQVDVKCFEKDSSVITFAGAFIALDPRLADHVANRGSNAMKAPAKVITLFEMSLKMIQTSPCRPSSFTRSASPLDSTLGR